MIARHLGVVATLLWVALRVPFLSPRVDTPQTRIEHLNRALRGGHEVRVTTLRGRFIVEGARADSLGLHWSRVIDRATVDSASVEEAATWHVVVRIERRASAWKKGTQLGAVWGGASAFAIGLVGGLAGGLDINSLTLAIVAGVGGFLVGAPVGAAVGAFHEDWKTVYPP